MVGIITLTRALILRDLIEERDRFEVERRHKVAAIAIGATTGFIIGITSAGSGTVIAILLIAIYRLSPKKVVGTDVFHAASCSRRRASPTGSAATSTSAWRAKILLGSLPGGHHRRRPLRESPAGLLPDRARGRPGRLRHLHDQEGRPDRLADRRRRSPPSASAGSSVAPRWLHRRRERNGASPGDLDARDERLARGPGVGGARQLLDYRAEARRRRGPRALRARLPSWRLARTAIQTSCRCLALPRYSIDSGGADWTLAIGPSTRADDVGDRDLVGGRAPASSRPWRRAERGRCRRASAPSRMCSRNCSGMSCASASLSPLMGPSSAAASSAAARTA